MDIDFQNRLNMCEFPEYCEEESASIVRSSSIMEDAIQDQVAQKVARGWATISERDTASGTINFMLLSFLFKMQIELRRRFMKSVYIVWHFEVHLYEHTLIAMGT